MGELRGYRFVFQALQSGVTVIALGMLDVVAGDFEDARAMALQWVRSTLQGGYATRICGTWALAPGEPLHVGKWFYGRAPDLVARRLQYRNGAERLEPFVDFPALMRSAFAWVDDRPEVDSVLVFRGDLVPGLAPTRAPEPQEVASRP